MDINTKYIKKNFLLPCTKFSIEKITSGVIIPGSIGFVCFNSNKDFNLYSLDAIIIRRGKKGRNRVDCVRIKSPAFFSEETDVAIVNNSCNILRIIPESFENNHILAMSNIEYIGWAISMANFLAFIYSTYSSKTAWPDGPINNLHNISSKELKLLEHEPDLFFEKYSTSKSRRTFIQAARRMYCSLMQSRLSSSKYLQKE